MHRLRRGIPAYTLLTRSRDSVDMSVDDSVLEIAVLYLFAKDKCSNQPVRLVPVLAFLLISLLSPLSLFSFLLPLFLLSPLSHLSHPSPLLPTSCGS
jgi:hypothetical protein